ncbi:MAG: hypothetical protein R3F35_05790 [Myxococcota bacterium]
MRGVFAFVSSLLLIGPLASAWLGCGAKPAFSGRGPASSDAHGASSSPADAPTGTASAPEASIPEWLVEARAREARFDGRFVVAAEDGWFASHLPARPEPASVPFEEEADYAFDVDVDAVDDVSITCRVQRTASSPPELLRSTSTALLESVGRAVGPIATRRIEAVTAGAIGAAPYLGIDWLFVASTDEGDVTDGLALRYAVKDEAGILCMKLGLGYAETLRAIFEQLVEGFTRTDPPPQPVFEEVVVASFAGQRLGVGRRIVRRDDEGDLQDEVLLHVLTPVGPDRTTAITSHRYEWVDGRDLRLLNAGMTSLRDGEEVSSLALEQADDGGSLLIRGHRAGEPVEVVLPAGPTVESNLAAIARTRAALAAPDPLEEALASRIWSDASPLAISDATLRITALVDAERARAVATVGGAVVELLLERATGQTLTSAWDVSGTPVVVERVFARGVP